MSNNKNKGKKNTNAKNILITGTVLVTSVVGLVFGNTNKTQTNKYINNIVSIVTGSKDKLSFGDQDTSIRCIDGDTFEITHENGDKEKVRMLGIDAPEYTTKKEEYGKEASAMACELLTEAEELELTFDKGNEIDKYGRSLYWVYVDGELLQEILVREGLAEIKYINKKTVNMVELKKLELAEAAAKSENLNIWKKR